MIERTQPVNLGTDEKGELIWGIIPMPRWQMEMFKVPYLGDFMAFWITRKFFDHTGFEPNDSSSMTINTRPQLNSKAYQARLKERRNTGD